MKHDEKSPLGLYTVGIAGLFLAGFLLLVILGAQSYRNTVDGQSENMHTRALLSYLATSVKAHDSADAVRVKDSEFGQMLVLEDGNSGYALRIYCKDGKLLEDFAAIDAALNPEEAQTLGKTDRFFLALEPEGFLRLETDGGCVLLQLRSRGGTP